MTKFERASHLLIIGLTSIVNFGLTEGFATGDGVAAAHREWSRRGAFDSLNPDQQRGVTSRLPLVSHGSLGAGSSNAQEVVRTIQESHTTEICCEPPRARDRGQELSVDSSLSESIKEPAPILHQITWYCLTGVMANGERVHHGAVAADKGVYALGTPLHVEGIGSVTVTDRFAYDLGQLRLDVWTPSCGQAIQNGVQFLGVTKEE